MDLDSYLKKIKPIMSAAHFAAVLGITDMHLSRIRTKKSFPSRALAMKVEDVTKGAVTSEEMMFPPDWEGHMQKQRNKTKEWLKKKSAASGE